MPPRTRRVQKLKPEAPRVNTTKKRSATKGFVWTNERKISLFECMIRRKPAGLLKHINMSFIKKELCERLQMDVPTKEIWSYLNTLWDMDLADRIEYPASFLKEKDFELPQTEEWRKLIDEQAALIDLLDAKKEAMKQTSQAATSNVDLKTFKTVKIMVERMDESMYAHKLPKKE